MKSDAPSLNRLHDIVVAPPVPWWPPAPGWRWVLVFVSVTAVTFIIGGLVRWQRNCYRREAQAELSRLGNVSGIAELLKRAAITAFPREQVASLTGTQWFEFLDSTGRTDAFAKGNGRNIEEAAYDPRVAGAIDGEQNRGLMRTARRWLAQHRAKGGAPC